MTSARIALKIPLTLLMFAMAALIVLPLTLMRAAFLAALGAYGAPEILLVVHTSIIGVVFAVLIAVFYQLGPVAFVTNGVNERWAFWQAIGYVLAGTAFLLSWLFLSAWGILPLAVTGTIVLICILVFFALVFNVVRHRTAGNMSALFAYAGLVHGLLLVGFATTLVWGLAEGWNLSFDRWIGAHALTGVYGIFIQFAIAFAYKLIPMFQLSHANLGKQPLITWVLLNVGLVLEDSGLFGGVDTLGGIGAALLLVGLVHFLFEVREIYLKRIRRQVEWPMRAVFIAWIWICLGTTLLVLWQWGLFSSPSIAEIVFAAVILGGLVQMITGYLFKIIPFLIWTARYGEGRLAANAPLLRDALRVVWSRAFVVLWNLGVVLLLVGIAAGLAPLIVLGAVILLVAILIGVREWWRVISPRGVFKPLGQ